MKNKLLQHKIHLILAAFYVSACFNLRYLITVASDFIHESAADYHTNRIIGLIAIYGALVILIASGVFMVIQLKKQRKLNSAPKSLLERLSFFSLMAITIFMPMLIGKIGLTVAYFITLGNAISIAVLFMLINIAYILFEKPLIRENRKLPL